MCLDYMLPQKEKDEILNEITEDGIKVYKVAKVDNGEYYPPYIGSQSYQGTMEADYQRNINLWRNNTSYCSGFHFFKSKKAATNLCAFLGEVYLGRDYKVIEATIKKEWITEIGIETQIQIQIPIQIDGKILPKQKNIVIVAKKAIFL